MLNLSLVIISILNLFSLTRGVALNILEAALLSNTTSAVCLSETQWAGNRHAHPSALFTFPLLCKLQRSSQLHQIHGDGLGSSAITTPGWVYTISSCYSPISPLRFLPLLWLTPLLSSLGRLGRRRRLARKCCRGQQPVVLRQDSNQGEKKETCLELVKPGLIVEDRTTLRNRSKSSFACEGEQTVGGIRKIKKARMK